MTVSEKEIQFSTREVPWLKLGKIQETPATAKEAAQLSGLDFEVELRDCASRDPATGEWCVVDKRKAVVRRDTGDFMEFVSSSVYQPLQYAEAFNFMDVVNPRYVAAGSLRGGRQGFMVVETPLRLNVLGGDDPHSLYGVLRTSHDRSRGVELSVMPLRGKCMNQLTLSTFAKDAEYRWAIKHTSTLNAKLAEAQLSLERIGAYVQRFEKLADKLVHIAVKPEKAKQLLTITIPQPRGKTEKVAVQYGERLESILNLWSTSPTVAYAGTGWGLVNAVSEYYDWYRAGGTPESRFLNALEGETHKRLNKMAGLLLAGV